MAKKKKEKVKEGLAVYEGLERPSGSNLVPIVKGLPPKDPDKPDKRRVFKLVHKDFLKPKKKKK